MKLQHMHRNLLMRLAGETLLQVFYWMFFPFMAIRLTTDFGPQQAGFMMMVPHLFSMFASLWGGGMADSLGRKPTMYIAMFIQSLAFLTFAMANGGAATANDGWIMFVAYLVLSCMYSVYLPAGQAMAADITSDDDRRQVFAMLQTSYTIGMIGGPLLGALFVDSYFHQLVLIGACVIAGYGFVILFFFQETRPSQTDASLSQNKETFLHKAKVQFQSYTTLAKDRVFLLYIVAGTLISVVMMQTTLYMAVYLESHVGDQQLLSIKGWALYVTGTTIYGWMMGINGAVILLLTVVAAKRLKHWSEKKALMISSLLLGIGLFLMGTTQNAWLLFLCMLCFSFGELIRTPVAQSFVSNYADKHKRGQYMGAASMQFMVARLLAPVFLIGSGWISSLALFTGILTLALLGVVVYSRMFRLLDSAVQERKGSRTR